MQKDSAILFECGRFWVSTDSRGDYCVWESGITHSIKRDTIGHSLPDALTRAIDKAKARNDCQCPDGPYHYPDCPKFTGNDPFAKLGAAMTK